MEKILAICALLFVGCGGTEDVVESVEQEVRQCAVRCADGYVLTKKCACEPSSCTVIALCIQGYSWDGARCQCVRAAGSGGGQACGSVTCPTGEVCCNASCGICTPRGGYCTQQVCGSTN